MESSASCRDVIVVFYDPRGEKPARKGGSHDERLWLKLSATSRDLACESDASRTTNEPEYLPHTFAFFFSSPS
ncbi:hypothetical protein ANTRET_LOCUS8008 [Anthophora retusa]